MRALTATLFLVSACTPATIEQEAPQPATSTSPVFDHAAGLKAHLEFLADDLLEGRDTGTRGYDLAARYAASQFRQAGFLPGGDSSTFFQTIRFRKARLTKARLTMTVAGKTRELKMWEEFVPYTSTNETKKSVKARAVFAGFGIVAPKFDIDDYAGLDVKEKFVVKLMGSPAQLPSEPRAHHASGRQQGYALNQRGAAATIALPSLQSERRFGYDKLKERAPSWTPMAWLDGDEPFADPPRLAGAVVSPQVARDIFKAAGKSYEDIQNAADGNPARTEAFELPVEFDLAVESEHSEITSANVVAVLPGSDPALREQVIVVSAHLDHLGIDKPVNGDAIYNGALDNGTGSAMVIELARAVKARHPGRTVALLLVTGEEKGLLGSDYFARKPSVVGKIVANINLDLLFWEPGTKKVVFYGEDSSSLGPVARKLATAVGYEMIPDPFPEQGFFTRSDHYSFVRQGIPALYFSTGFDNNGAAAKDYIANHYHQPSDQLGSIRVDYAEGAKLVLLVADLVAEIGNAAAAPTWTPGNFFTELYGKR